jgi:hypothetical protein
LSIPQIGSLDSVQVTFDTSHNASTTIGAEGGTLSTTAADGTVYELVIPADALDFDETISMIPVSSVDGLPLSGGLVGAVMLEPAGIIFYEPATLRITLSAPITGDIQVGFAYEGTGEEFHLQRLISETSTTGMIPDSDFLLNAIALIKNASTGTVELAVPSTRGYGAGSGTQKDITSRQNEPRPKDPMDNIDELMLPLSPNIKIPAIELPEFIKEMSNTFNTGILPLINAAQTNPELSDNALLLYDRWLAYVIEFDLSDDLDNELTTARVALVEMLNKVSENSAERCYTEKRPEEAFALQRWIQYARKFLSNSPAILEMQTRISKCLTFKMKFHTLITEKDEDYGYSYELNSELTLKATKSMSATGSAPLNYADGHWIGSDGCSFAMQGESSLFDSETGDLGLSIAPVSRTSPAVNITFRYDPGIPVEQTTMSCPEVEPLHWTTSAWQTYFSEMHFPELKGSGYEITSEITDAGSFTGWIINNTTTGPSGQDVTEDTQIEIIHTPSR